MIPEIIPVKNYSGNDVTTKFDFDFYIENENQLVVYHTNKDGVQTLLELGKDYAINEVGQENGSFITFPITGSNYPILQGESSYGVGDAEKISLCLYLPISQETEYGTSDKLDQKSLEYSLDYLTRLIQILNRQMERSIKVPEGAELDLKSLLERINSIYNKLTELNEIYSEIDNINAVNDNKENINICADNIEDIINAKTNAQTCIDKAESASQSEINANKYMSNAQIWAEGSDSDIAELGGVHSAKEWAEISAQGQLQSDFNQTNTESKDFIKNKPRIKTWTTTVSTTWVGSESPYTQEITLTGMLATDNVLIALKSNSATSIKDCQKELSKIFFAETLEGKLKLYAKSPTKTEINLLVYESEKE